MPRGKSGKVVVELDPALKQDLYAELAREGLTLKEWLTGQAQIYIASRRQPGLFDLEPPGGREGHNG